MKPKILKYSPIKSPKLWKDSKGIAWKVIGVLYSIKGIVNFKFDFIDEWWVHLTLIIIGYAFLVAMILAVKIFRTKKGVSFKIRGIYITIKQGNIFCGKGWKLIPFNENFDTQVDDKIISHSSLHGIFIDKYVKNLEKLTQIINSDLNRKKSRLGHIIPYEDDYMLLAFTHFNKENESHISWSEYESCLRQMWPEISRMHAGKPVNLPLLGGGITRFDNVNEKLKFDLLECMLFTLKTSAVHISQPITIFLDKKTIDEINIYEFKRS